ncbi:MAG: tyrosine-type recombinase/integrase [Bacteroidales bacterium]|nr:tyrosine-type recombinase/integrase [Bacteroidales bacterium]
MHIEKFIGFITTEKRYSPHTTKAYLSDLRQFESFIQNEFELSDILKADHTMVKSWSIALKSNGLDNRSINRKYTTLRTFYHYCLKNELIDSLPVDRVKSLKIKKRLPVFIPLSDIENISASIPGETYESKRDNLIVEVLYHTGMRLAELTQLKESDIDFRSNILKVNGKRNKQRLIPFHSSLNRLFLDYIRARNEEIDVKTNTLFVTKSGKPAYPEMINKIVHTKLKEITTIQKTSPHVLRHTFATHLLNNGANLMAIKELLGHSSLSATQVYTHTSIEQLKKIHQQAHPKG